MIITENLLVSKDPYDYKYVSQGETTVLNLDDGEELKLTDVKITFDFFQR